MKGKPLIGLAAALAAAPGLAAAGDEIDERRDMDPAGTVVVINVAGDIEIMTWDESAVHLTGELGEHSTLEITETAQGIRIEVKREDDRDYRRHYEETELNLMVPLKASISASGISSDITISGSMGDSITAETVSGDLEVSAEVRRAELTSVSGDVEFTGQSSRTVAETVSGDVELYGIGGELEVSLVSGDLYLEGIGFDSAKFESVSGTLELSLEVNRGGRLSVETMSGDVELSLPDGQPGEFRAQTFSGDISSAFGSPQKSERGPGTRLRHVADDPGTTITVESFSGDIDIGQK